MENILSQLSIKILVIGQIFLKEKDISIRKKEALAKKN